MKQHKQIKRPIANAYADAYTYTYAYADAYVYAYATANAYAIAYAYADAYVYANANALKPYYKLAFKPTVSIMSVGLSIKYMMRKETA